MSGKSYSEKLRDPRWQRRRLEIMQHANFACEHCMSPDKTLNVHHKLYRKGRAPWEYADGELECLCEECHETAHGWRARLDEALARGADLERVVGFADASLAEVLIFEEDQDGNPLVCSWPMRSYEYTWGFLSALQGRPRIEEVEALLNASPLSNRDVFALGPHKVSPLELREKDSEST